MYVYTCKFKAETVIIMIMFGYVECPHSCRQGRDRQCQ